MARTLFPGENRARQDHARLRRAARRRRGRRRAASRAGAGRRNGDVPARCGSAATSPRWIWWSARRCRPAELAARVRAALKPIAPNLPGNDFRTLQQLVDKAVSPRRFVVLLLGGFAVFALVLASLGIYGVISYSVNQRTQEIGIRMALGASARSLQAGIVRQTLGLAAVGMLIGGAARGRWRGRSSGLLFGVTPSDPADVSRDAARADPWSPHRRLSAGTPGLPDRSFHRAAGELNYSCLSAAIGSIRDAFHAGA